MAVVIKSEPFCRRAIAVGDFERGQFNGFDDADLKKRVVDSAEVVLTRRMCVLLNSMTYRRPALSIVISNMELKLAEAPTPSRGFGAATPFPARVDTSPAGVTLRIQALFLSATYIVPRASTETAAGELNLAFVPNPSTRPAACCPARVVVKPVVVTTRIALLPESATRRFWLRVTTMPRGDLKLAAAPAPSTSAGAPLPDSTVTILLPSMTRMTLFPESATKMFRDEGSTAIPDGALNPALAPTAIARPEVPEPANVAKTLLVKE
jgi:hypothetical protein